MTERERLIEICDTNNGWVDEVTAEKFADYLLANNVIILPCKVGDTIYGITIGGVSNLKIEQIHCWSNGMWKFNCWGGKGKYRVGYEFSIDDFGKTVFLSKEEAEQALKEEQNHD